VASGVHCGLRRRREDLALIVSDRPASAAAVFTTNLVQAAPILVCRASLEATNGIGRAILVNSGNANACTGEDGLRAARLTAARAAGLLGVQPEMVLVASTGVIGQGSRRRSSKAWGARDSPDREGRPRPRRS
jgi:glutamate N-acetyltransferase/amino-acid N-acetyltransferase